MLTMDFESLQNIIETEDFNELVGCSENEFLEAKSEPYNLESESGRFELAKDVSSFANAGGGYLLIGVTTIKKKDSDQEIINGFQDFSQSDFNPSQYEGIIGDYVFPKIVGINVRQSPVFNSNSRIGIVFIPAQKEEDKPFLINKVFDEGEKIKGIVFGCSMRSESSSMPYTVKKIQQLIKKGKSNTTQILIRIEEKIDLILKNNSTEPENNAGSTFDLLDSRLNSLLDVE